MEQGKINVPQFAGVMLLYIVLSTLGFFTQIEAVLLPVFALPFALYIVKNKPPVRLQVVFHIIMLLLNYFVAGSDLMAALIYGVSVMAPAYILVYLYQEQLTLPHWIMYAGIALCTLVFITLTMMKMVGTDLEAIYRSLIDQIKMMFTEATKTLISLQTGEAAVASETIAALNERQQYVVQALETMKAFYAYTVVTIVMTTTAFTVLCFNGILRRRDKNLPSIRQLTEFRLSKMATVPFLGAVLLVSAAGTEPSALMILGLNVMNLFIWLFRIVGGLGLIGLVSHSAAHGGFKVLGYVGIALSFGIFPYLVMLFGFLDAFFNYRKVEIVV